MQKNYEKDNSSFLRFSIFLRCPQEKKTFSQSGFAVYMVLVILSIVALLLSVSLIRVGAIRKSISAEQKKFQARMLAESGIVRAEYFLNGGDGHSLDWETDNYTESADNFGTIAVTNKKWGAYSQIESSGNRLDYRCTIQSLLGRDMPELLDPVITLTGHAGGLELRDSSRLSGTVAMFHGGIKYHKSPVIIRVSPSLPFDSTAVNETVKRCNEQFLALLANKNSLTGNVVLNETSKIPDTLAVLGDLDCSSVSIYRKHIAVSGKIIINSATYVDASVLMCEKCEIKSGETKKSLIYSQKKLTIENGMHSSQFITGDSLIIGKSARFGTMTLCVNYRDLHNDTFASGGVYLDENAKFRGIIISAMDTLAKKRDWRSSIVLGKNAEVQGLLITNQSIYMRENRIKGHIWTQQIESTDGKVAYTNYLWGCIVAPADIQFPFPLFGPEPVKIVPGERTTAYEKCALVK